MAGDAIPTAITIALVLFLLSAVDECAPTVGSTVTLSSSSVLRGLTEDVADGSGAQRKVDSFLGIPFAQPPIGNLRFRPPRKVEPWKGVLNATRHPDTCWQYLLPPTDMANDGLRIWANNTPLNEDCLYLNVYTPRLSNGPKLTKLAPVLVWIFGGGFTQGSATLEIYNGQFFAAMEDVVVVAMQYRVGAFGLLYLKPQSVNDYDAPALGNMGLLDQRMALMWVKDNIKSFGGDPDQVTLFGESAGAVSVSAHVLSPLSQQLFRRAILQSSSIMSRWALDSPEEANDKSLKFAAQSGCNTGRLSRTAIVECLQSVQPETLVKAIDDVSAAMTTRRTARLKELLGNEFPSTYLNSTSMYFTVVLRPVIDGYFLPDCPEVLFEIAKVKPWQFATKELMIGTNLNEAIFFILYGLPIAEHKFFQDNGTITKPTTEALHKLKLDAQVTAAAAFLSDEHLTPETWKIPAVSYGLTGSAARNVAINLYGMPQKQVISSDDLFTRLDNFAGDVDFICPTLAFADLSVRYLGAKVQYYNFRYQTVGAPLPKWLGTMHGYEVDYVFGMPFSSRFQTEFYKFNDDERILSKNIMRAWTNFARTGNANTNSDGSSVQPIWPDFVPADMNNGLPEEYLELDYQLKVNSKLRGDKCLIWNTILPNILRTNKTKSAASAHMCQQFDYITYARPNLAPSPGPSCGSNSITPSVISAIFIFLSLLLSILA